MTPSSPTTARPDTATTPPAPPRSPRPARARTIRRPMTPPKPSSAEQAREWLQAELAAWAKVLDTGPADLKAKIAPTLQHWKEDTDLVGIRDEKELAKLPEEERAALKALWNDVDQLLANGAGQQVAPFLECPRCHSIMGE